MVSGPSRFCRLHTFETKAGKGQLFDENIDDTHWIVRGHIVVQEFGQQRCPRKQNQRKAASTFNFRSEGDMSNPDAWAPTQLTPTRRPSRSSPGSHRSRKV